MPDLPEHRNSMDAGPLSLHDCALRVADLIGKTVSGGKAHAIGHSLGGKTIVEMLALRPDVVDRAVIASALFRPAPVFQLTHRRYIYRMTVSMLKSEWALSATAKQFGFKEKEDADKLKEDFRRLTPDSLYRIYDQLYQHLKLPEGLTGCEAPALVVAGQKELKAMRLSVPDIVEQLPNSKGVIIKGANHTYPWEMSDTFNEIAKAWLEGKDITRGDCVIL